VDFTSRGKDPDLRLKRPGRNRYETDQVHMLEVHESFAYFAPVSIDASVHGVPPWSGCKPQTPGDFAVMWTDSHGFNVPAELRVIATRSFAQPKVGICTDDQQTITRMDQWSSPEPSTQEASIDVSSVRGRNRGNGHTENLQEMVPAMFRNIRPSRPLRLCGTSNHRGAKVGVEVETSLVSVFKK